LGILAHVDAGKTTLTERLLYAAGVIDELGSVDSGTTQTDSLALERQRGITIKSAVVSFAIADVTVNLIDTPGHPDFIAEVERVLSVLDGAVLVISAVEGVQPQTRVLMRALERLRVPTLMFVNKIDRRGASYEETLRAISERLTPAIVPMGSTSDLGTRAAAFVPWDRADASAVETLTEVLGEQNDSILSAYLSNGVGLSAKRLRRELGTQTRRLLVHPVYFGSALTGAGIQALMAGIGELLPKAGREIDGPVSGRVFKVERGAAGEKLAYVRLFSGTVRTRDTLRFGKDVERKVTAVSVLAHGSDFRPGPVSAGEIAKLSGLPEIQVGDAIGTAMMQAHEHHFPPPTLETVILPRNPADNGAMRVALAQLAEQDPLINVRQDDALRETYISLYGEVQKEVIGSTLADEFGIGVTFRTTTTICIERPVRTGGAVERIREPANPFLATVGLRVEPAAAGSNVRFRVAVDVLGTMPMAFFRAVEDTVRETLRQGLRGWEVTDCVVTMTHSGYYPRQSHAHQRFSKAMSSTGEDFRGLTPLVLMEALAQAGTAVCEPIQRFRLDVPADTLAALLPALARIEAVPRLQVVHGLACTLEGDVPASRVHDLRQQLPALTGGDGVLESTFDRYESVSGRAPSRRRTDLNPLHRKEYLLAVTRRTSNA
jgi:ribosomal protection tetracycline resistance protein